MRSWFRVRDTQMHNNTEYKGCILPCSLHPNIPYLHPHIPSCLTTFWFSRDFSVILIVRLIENEIKPIFPWSILSGYSWLAIKWALSNTGIKDLLSAILNERGCCINQGVFDMYFKLIILFSGCMFSPVQHPFSSANCHSFDNHPWIFLWAGTPSHFLTRIICM